MLEPVLDPEQLARIEATHRGFAYQHLYAVACLLSMDATGTDTLIIEHDEDVELVRNDEHIYVQVKTRNRALRLSDIDTALERFSRLREEHDQGRRSGTTRFVVVSNAAPGPDLAAQIATAGWPVDVLVLWPQSAEVDANLQLQPAWPDLAGALRACISIAALIPFGSLTPETLVFKLAGLVQYIASGHRGHRVTSAEVTVFFKQLVIQLHEFPEPPTSYRPLLDEPDLLAPAPVRLLVGVSGAGKTAWASRAALHDAGPVAYLDASELPAAALATSLARELAARFLAGATSGAGSAALPSASGLELLAAVCPPAAG